MKTIFLFTIAFLSFTAISAQSDAQKPAIENAKIYETKVDFFKALVAKNNFDIVIKEYEKTAAAKKVTTATKKEFYNLLLEKNGFDIIVNDSNQTEITYNKKEIIKEIKNKNAPKALGDF